MVPEQRRQVLSQTIFDQGGATIKDLSERFDVSEMTIRRDLRQLAKEGQVRITHGGAVPASTKGGSEQLYALKEPINRMAKSIIGRYAAEHFVHDHDVIILDPGTTAVHMIPHLRTKTGLTVVTNGLQTLNSLKAQLPQAQLICTGGMLRGVSETFVGPVAEAFFHGFFATRYFVSSVGATLAEGLTDPQMLDTQVKKAMIRSAGDTVALLDSSKFGVRSTVEIAPFASFRAVVTDSLLGSDVAADLSELTEVRQVEV